MVNISNNYCKVHTDTKEDKKQKSEPNQKEKPEVKSSAAIGKLSFEDKNKRKIVLSGKYHGGSKTRKHPPTKVDNVVVNLHYDSAEKREFRVLHRALMTVAGIFFISALLTVFVYQTMIIGSTNETARDVSDGSGTKVLTYNGKTKYVMYPDPPPAKDLAAVARYVMHISEWGALATNSTHKGIEGYPFVNIFSVSDGPYKNSTGVPYFYLTPMELSVIDIQASNKVSLTVTEAQSNYCNKNGYDPEDPRCAHVIFTGSITKLEKDTEEELFAKKALFERHVEMKDWPAGHDWFFAKLDIIHIYLLDYFGGVATVKPENYFATNPFDSDK